MKGFRMTFENRVYVNTLFNNEEIRQSMTSSSDIVRKHADDVIRLKEQGVIDALISLGWTPPKGVYGSNEHTNKKD
jgi:hypothetical protein